MQKDPIHVVYASDGFYFPYIYVSVKTLLENNKMDDVIVHYIQQNVETQQLEKLQELGISFKKTIDSIPFSIPEEFDEILPAYGVASKTTYIKFWFASMFPDLDKVLYLDPDTLVLGSLREMYDTDLGDNLIGGVIECLPYYHRVASKMSDSQSYINGGMVLCNLRQWRNMHFERLALERLKDTSHNLNYDQGVLNEICGSHIKLLDPKYNVLAEVFQFKNAQQIKHRYGFSYYYSQEQINNAINNPVIVHFTGFLYGKPMNLKCDHPFAAYFRKILEQSPIDYRFTNTALPTKVRIRKFIINHFPFTLYNAFEHFLDIRRKRIL